VQCSTMQQHCCRAAVAVAQCFARFSQCKGHAVLEATTTITTIWLVMVIAVMGTADLLGAADVGLSSRLCRSFGLLVQGPDWGTGLDW
jgi:hypothetical protein